MYDYPQHIHEFEPELDTTTNLRIVHAPNSQIDLRKVDTNTKGIKILESNPDFGLEKSTEVYHDVLLDKLNQNIQSRDVNTYNSVKKFLKDNNHDQLYGDFQPNVHRFQYREGESLNPTLFLASYLLEQSYYTNKTIELVFHPDIIFFLTQGNRSKEVKVLNSINELCKSLNIKMFFENIYFARDVFSTNFAWMSDPVKLQSLVKNYSNLGVTIDLDHLLKENWSKERISNTVKSITNDLKGRVIIHSRLSHNGNFSELYLKMVSNGIPWVNEIGTE